MSLRQGFWLARSISSEALDVTRVIIAHRPETIRTADRVLLLEKGVLCDVTPPELKQPLAGMGSLRPSE